MGAEAKTVLVVDDDEGMLDMAARVLAEAGYRVETALNGRQALRVLERRMPQLIVLDTRMPVMNGWEFAREFHARYGTDVPIVVCSGSADPRKDAQEMGAVEGLPKTFDLDELLAAVDRWTGQGTTG